MVLRKAIVTCCMVLTLCFSTALTVSATSGVDLNAVGANTSSSVASDTSANNNAVSSGRDYSATNDAIIDNINSNTSITESDMEKAASIATPVVNVIRWAISILLAVFPAILIFNSLVDFMCITLSPLRRAVLSANSGGSGGGMGGMGMMGMGGMSGGGQQSSGGIFDTIAKWASDEAVAAVKETSSDGGSGGGMGGMGMMGMGGMGGGGSAPAKKKSTLIVYFKKRVVALVVAGICLLCFACTAFTDLGLNLGAWIVDKIGSISI